jgi:ArsR family transcriptional regulator
MVISLEKEQLSLLVEIRFNLISEMVTAIGLHDDPAMPADLQVRACRIRETANPSAWEKLNKLREASAGEWFDVLRIACLASDQWQGDWREQLKRWRAAKPLEILLPYFETWLDPDDADRMLAGEIPVGRLSALLARAGMEQKSIESMQALVAESENSYGILLDQLKKILPITESDYELCLPLFGDFREQMENLAKSQPIAEILRRLSPRFRIGEDQILEVPAYGMRFDLRRFAKILIVPTSYGYTSFSIYRRHLLLFVKANFFQTSGPVLPAAPELIRHAHALSDPANLLILRHLARRPLCVKEIAEAMSISQPLATKHVQELRAAGIVSEMFRSRNRVYLRINFREMEKVFQELLQYVKS